VASNEYRTKEPLKRLQKLETEFRYDIIYIRLPQTVQTPRATTTSWATRIDTWSKFCTGSPQFWSDPLNSQLFRAFCSVHGNSHTWLHVGGKKQKYMLKKLGATVQNLVVRDRCTPGAYSNVPHVGLTLHTGSLRLTNHNWKIGGHIKQVLPLT
jgi:hypothetical protein